MSPLNRDGLRFTRLTVQAQILQQPALAAPLVPGQVIQAPQTLSAQAIARIYGEVAQFGFTSLNQVPGGAQAATPDGISTVVVAAGVLQYVEDLTRSSIRIAIDRLGPVVDAYWKELTPGAVVLAEAVDLQGVWEGAGESAPDFIRRRFLKPAAERIVDDLGFELNGGAIRLAIVRPSPTALPPGIGLVGPQGPVEAIDVRIEPLFTDLSKLFLQVTGQYPPSSDHREIARRTEMTYEIAWERVARNIVAVQEGREDPG